MPIFRNTAGKLSKLGAIPLDKEKELQILIVKNLKEVLDPQFLQVEYTTTFDGRIDILAVDSSGAPVIIEYKRNKNDNVINQALSYLKVAESLTFADLTHAIKSTSTSTSATGVEGLLIKADDSTAELFKELRERILELDDTVEEKATAWYVAYKRANNFAEVHIGKSQLKIHLRPIDYVDPEGKVDKIPDGYNWTMDRRIYLKSKTDLDYVVNIIEQSYQTVL